MQPDSILNEVLARPLPPAKQPAAAALYFLVIVFPPLIFYMTIASSQTPGVAIVAFLLVGRRFTLVRQRGRGSRTELRAISIAALVALLVALHFGVAATFLAVDVFRAIASLVPLALLLAAGSLLGEAFLSIPGWKLRRGIVACFFLMSACGFIAALNLPVPNPGDWRKPVFPFSEPATFALAFIPLFIYVSVVSSGWKRLCFLLTGLLCTAFIQNLTLAIGFLLVALVTLRWYQFLLLVAVALVAGLQLDLTYYVSRLDFSGDEFNLSNLVYLQGLQMVPESWERSSGWGLGFMQLGLQGTEVEAAQIIRAFRDGEDSNLLEGGFTFAKLASEFGLVGIILTVVLLRYVWRSFVVLRATARRPFRSPSVVTLAHCAVFAYAVELLVRSAGYFTAGSLLLVAGLQILNLHAVVSAPKWCGEPTTEGTTYRGGKTPRASGVGAG